MIACDCQATHTSGFKFKVKTKLFEFENPLLYPTKFTMGFCGDINNIPDVLDYLGDITGKTKAPRRNANNEFVVLTADHKIYTFWQADKWIQVDGNFYSIGSGMHYALGALHAGASPKEAVVAASKLDPSTGLGVKVVEYE